jgi:hypothetical protein
MTTDDAQSRVERAARVFDEVNKVFGCIPHNAAQGVAEKMHAILTAPTDSSAGSSEKSDPDGTNVASGETGGRSLPPPAEVKPSERIRDIARRRTPEGERLANWGHASPERIPEAILEYLDEQHARGRK